LILAGEVVTEVDISLWSSINMVVAYGLTECAITCMVQRRPSLKAGANSIGYGEGVIPWIVNPQNVDKLVPLGAVGELLLEGPLIGRGYLEDETHQTSTSFINPPSWRAAFLVSPIFRFYKTGDLVRYGLDGSISYIGRKDSQVKLRGQRIELSDVEFHVQRQFPESRAIIADVITPDDGSSPFLAAFLKWQQSYAGLGIVEEVDREAGSFFLPPTDEYMHAVSQAREALREILPNHMIPSVFLPIYHVPIRPTGKADSQLLRSEAACLSKNRRVAYNSVPKQLERPVASKTEEMLQLLYCRLLDLSPEFVSLNSSLLQLGGDSLTAMKLR
jgi:acyl-CoA synthetase (AMP-forming)/AMP-acid ligase II